MIITRIILIFILILIIAFLFYYLVLCIQTRKAAIEVMKEKSNKSSAPTIDISKIKDISENGFKVAGISYYKNNIKKILNKNTSESSKYVYRAKQTYVALVPEPDNKYDKNAIAVYMNDYKIGHVPAEIVPFIRNIMDDYDFLGTITNGDYYEDDEIIEENFSCKVEIEYEN